MQPVSLVADTLVVKDSESYIIYSPFSGKIARVPAYPDIGFAVYEALENTGFFGKVPDTTKRDTVQTWDGFHSLTLLLTRRCNLGCSYCYASAKPTGNSMLEELAVGSLEWFIRQLRNDSIRVSFHGGGEPTLESNLIKTVVARAKEICGKKKLRFQVVTNGTANAEFMDWLADEKFGILISMDGPPDIQDRNRPLAIGGGSSVVVEQTIRRLVAQNYPFTVRLTFSPADDIVRIIRYFGNLGVRSLHIEPLFPHGREYEVVAFGKRQNLYDIYSPEGGELLVSFLKAIEIAKEYGMRITNGHLSHFTKGVGYFCGAASGRSMMVTHDGFLSGCLDVVDAQDKDSKIFFLGRYLPYERRFELNENQLATMQNRHADALPECKTCYARYTCAGGCAVKAVRASGDFFERDLPYCRFTKALVPIIVKRIAQASNI